MSGEYVEGSWYYYAPNKVAPIVFAVAFGVSTLLHIWQCIRYKCFKLTFLFCFCGLTLTAGFASRIYGAWHYDNIDVFIATTFLVYAAPPLLELANYHVLGRVLYFVPYCTPLHPGRVFTTFAFLSCAVEILNALGVMYSSIRGVSEATANTGKALLKTSLILQLVVAALFTALQVVFHRRCSRRGITRNPKVTRPLATLYFSTALITIRTVYRVVEYWALEAVGSHVGDASPVVRFEWFFYVFEAAVVLLDCLLFNVLHPRRYLPEKSEIYLAQDGQTELVGPGWEDKRPFLVTLCDPFDFAGALASNKTNQNFWDKDSSEAVALHPQARRQDMPYEPLRPEQPMRYEQMRHEQV